MTNGNNIAQTAALRELYTAGASPVVFYKPNGKVAVIDDDDDSDVNINQFVHRQLYRKSENNHSIRDIGIIRNSCTEQAGSSFLF